MGGILGILMVLALFSVGVGVVASNRGRSGVGWFFIAMLISPLLAVIILLVMQDLSRAQQAPPAQAIHANQVQMNAPVDAKSSASSAMSISENEPLDDDYSAAMEEVRGQDRKAGAWAKAYAEALGDDAKATALYVGRRAAEFSATRHAAELEEHRLSEAGRAQLAREAYESIPKGTCPNCKTVLPLDAVTCPSSRCGATFDAPGGWRITPLAAD